jgi:hypothetical protein
MYEVSVYDGSARVVLEGYRWSVYLWAGRKADQKKWCRKRKVLQFACP